MNAETLIVLITRAGFYVLLILVLRRALRYPRPANWYALAFFTLAAGLITVDVVNATFEEPGVPPWVAPALLLLLPYPLLRQADEFAGVRPLHMRIAEVGAAGSTLLILIGNGEIRPGILGIGVFACFTWTAGLASRRFLQAGRMNHGVPRKRLLSAAAGSAFIALLVLLAIPAGIFPGGPWSSLSALVAFGAGVSYFIAFATPPMLRDAWQAPELRRFISETTISSLDEAESLEALAVSLEESVTQVMGGRALLLIVREDDRVFDAPGLGTDETTHLAYQSPRTTVAYRAFMAQRSIFDPDPIHSDPANQRVYE